MDSSSRQDNAAVEVLVSYSHKDDRFRQNLETHLSLLSRQGVISVWHDRRITPGTEWKSQIDAHLDSASLILLLVSPDFLASDYCYEIEMTRALERHDAGSARVIPIIVHPVDWHGAPFGKLQALPKDGKPISTWRNRGEALHDVARGIRRAVEELRAATPVRSEAPTPGVLRVPHNSGERPPWLEPVGRTDTPLPLRAATESQAVGTAAEHKDASQFVSFDISSVGKSVATVSWMTSTNAPISLTLYLPGQAKPVLQVRRDSLAMVQQDFTFDGLQPATNYQIVLEAPGDRKQVGVKTLDSWMT